jgi:hypothetical protein
VLPASVLLPNLQVLPGERFGKMSFLPSVNCARPHAFLLFLSLAAGTVGNWQARAQENVAPQKAAPALGTVKAIAEKSLVLTTDAGTELNIQFSPTMRVLRVEPGSKTLKDAVTIPLTDLAVGDRVLVRGETGAQANAMVAGTIVAMKKEDIAKKQAKEREEWQRHGIGGLVKSVDPAKEIIVISTLGASGTKEVLIHAPVGAILRRYSSNSVNFDDAKVAPFTEIKAGDQLRARGSPSAEGSEFTADEIVSGTFQNISGTIASIDAAKGTLAVADLVTKKNVELEVTSDSQMRQLSAQIAQRIAMRLKGTSPDANGSSGNSGSSAAPQAAAAQAAASSARQGAAAGNTGPGAGQRGNSDVQQMLSRLPTSPLGDFQKGDAVMIVATAGANGSHPTVITLLGGVEAILQSAPQGQASSILTPWSLNSGGGGDSGTQ